MSWQRARKPDQKVERVRAILDSAANLFEENDLSEISMRDVSAAAGLSKASLYSYFKTKEEVFATLFLQEIQMWLAEIESKLKRLRSPNSTRVAKVLTEALREKPRFCRLSAVLSSVLERNMSQEFIRDFKTELNANLGQAIVALQGVIPKMTVESGMEFLFQHQALIAGLWPLTHPSPQVAEVIASEGFDTMQLDFFDLFQRTIERLLAD